MTKLIVSTVLTLVVVAIAVEAFRFTKKRTAPYVAPLAALGVVLVFRTGVGFFTNPHKPHHLSDGYFLARAYTSVETAILWWLFIIMVLFVLVRVATPQRMYDRLPGAVTAPIWKSIIRGLAWVLLVYAVTVPLTWLSPLAKVALLVLVLVWSLVQASKAVKGRKDDRKQSLVLGAFAAVGLIFVLIAVRNIPFTFWTDDVPADFGKQTCRILGNPESIAECHADHHGSSGQGKGGNSQSQAAPASYTYKGSYTSDKGRVVVICATLAACKDGLIKHQHYAQDFANHYGVPTSVVYSVAGGKGVPSGLPTISSNGLKDHPEAYMSVGDPCVLPDGNVGTEEKSSDTLKCIRTKGSS